MAIRKIQVNQQVIITSVSNKDARCTFAFRRVQRMVQVAVSFCAPDDKWKKATGHMIVQDRINDAIGSDDFWNVISLPLGHMTDDQVADILAQMFFEDLPSYEYLYQSE